MKPRPVRVLHLRDSPWVDGPGRTILETASRIDRDRVDYHVGVFVADPARSHPLVEALRARGLSVHEILDRGGIDPELVDAIVGLLQRLHIDILHTSEFRANLLALLCRRRRPVDLVSTAHGWITNDLRGKVYAIADRCLLRCFDRVILVSHAMRQRLPAWWVADSRVRILHNALMVDSYGQPVWQAERRVPDPGSDVRLLCVGRLSQEKGQNLLIRAVANLRHDYPGIRIAFAGTGPMEHELRYLSAQLGIADRVRFLGYVQDMPSLYSESDLVVQGSSTEGLPNVMLEAAFLGVPVVATNVGGTSEVIQQGESGILVRPGSVDALQDGIRQYLEQPARLFATASAARRRIETLFSFSARTDAQTRLYEELATESTQSGEAGP